MGTLTISDLTLDKELDAKAMAEVFGGRMTKKLPYPGFLGKGHKYDPKPPRGHKMGHKNRHFTILPTL